jgi:hypothetical protein
MPPGAGRIPTSGEMVFQDIAAQSLWTREATTDPIMAGCDPNHTRV